MRILRLSNHALENILNGKTKENFKCVIKFYSNHCKFCHELKGDYQDIADEFKDVHFFAFNASKYDDLESLININGVPTIAFINAKASPRVAILADPKPPDPKKWYFKKDIVSFIESQLDE
jgi:thiol-disulfide isomerase/thioredoxin